jgi:2-amino-4-hydroxy-6-hydroxymethyldihydropteridine diphosphokinase
MNDEARAYISLGSNVGDRLRALREALEALTAGDDLRVDFETGIASLYETSPVGGPMGQSAYLNSVVRVVTRLAPIELLQRLLAIEASLGRTRKIRWDRRVIDLDLLLYGGLVLDHRKLTLPHPRFHERRFVLEPLFDIAADVMHPTLGKTVSQMAAELREGSSGESVVRVAGAAWRFEPISVDVR